MATIEQLSAALVKADAAGNADDARALAAEIRKMRGAPVTPKAKPTMGQMLKDEALTSLPGGLVRGVKDVIDTGAQYAAKLLGGDEAAVKAGNEAGEAEFNQAQENVGAGGSDVARVGGQILATLPVARVLGAGLRGVGATRLGNAVASGGMTLGGKAATTFAGKAGNLALRSAGAGIAGYTSAGLVDPDSAALGGAIGAVLPPAVKLAGVGGNALASIVRPFTGKGQERIAGNALRQFATDPTEAAFNLSRAREMVPGSMPTAVAAAGDEGLAGLSRTLQSTNPQYAAELSARGASQNAARTAAIEGVAGNTGKIEIAKQARDVATGPMREAVLDAAGKLPASSVLNSIDNLLAKPDNAGKQAQSALAEVRKRIAQFAPDGNIDARALYAIRKDINDTLGGKLQGEAGNMKLASGQLIEVKAIIDDAIDLASRAMPTSGSRELVAGAGRLGASGNGGAFGGTPRASWKQYLREYSTQSVPIKQMEELENILNRVSTGTVDKSGGAVLSAAKLNNLLRNEAKDLAKNLSDEQLQVLRRVSADLNANQIAGNAGKAIGSNTVQNLASSNTLASILGQGAAGSTLGQSALNRLLQLPYGSSNAMIQEKLGKAMLDPAEMARLLQEPGANKLLQRMGGLAPIGYRAAPLIASQR